MQTNISAIVPFATAVTPDINPWSVPFLTQALPDASLAAANPYLPYPGGCTALLQRFAWAVPQGGVAGTMPTKVFYADRYGGDGILRNGGGARCASDGKWQIKGSGLNPLAGVENDGLIGRAGTITLAECLQEALWSEIFGRALPYGSTRIVAVIRTGTRDAGAVREVDGTLGMAVREAAWRPAHFLRAHAFRPVPQATPILPSDTERVRSTVATLDWVLPTSFGWETGQWVSQSRVARLAAGLNEMVRRFAEQIAAGVAKRLSHGTLTASNVCLDGRWIDFATASAQPGWANSSDCLCRLTDEYKVLARPLAALCFYIGKYFPASRDERAQLPKADELLDLYIYHYSRALDRRMAGLSGCQGILADLLWDDRHGQAAMRTLGQLLLQLGCSGSSRHYPSPHTDISSGDYDMAAILDVLSRCTGASKDNHLARLIPSAELRAQVSIAHAEVVAAVHALAERDRIQPHALKRLMRLHARKALLVEPMFYRDRMNARVEQMVVEINESDAFCREAESLWRFVGQRARLMYEDAVGYTCLLWCTDEFDLLYDASADAVFAKWSDHIRRFTWTEFCGDVMPVELVTCKRDMHHFWRDEAWNTI